jgi:hypothetical protein
VQSYFSELAFSDQTGFSMGWRDIMGLTFWEMDDLMHDQQRKRRELNDAHKRAAAEAKAAAKAKARR